MTMQSIFGSFAAGAVSTYFFHKPALNKEGISLLLLGGWQGTALTGAAFMITLAMAGGSEIIGVYRERDEKTFKTFFVTGLILTAYLQIAMPCLGTPIETLVKFAVSSVLFVKGFPTPNYS